jgi:hypothetical protein
MPIQIGLAEYRENRAEGCNWASLWQIFRHRVSIGNSDVKIDQLQPKMVLTFWHVDSSIFSDVELMQPD